jgi:acetylornithine/N-succinyldiaminopimelate aminotransferase
MSAARATLAVMEAEDVPARARASGARLRAGLEQLPGVASVRGQGLLLAAVLTGEYAGPACREALASGLVINSPGPDVLRFAPSLLVSGDEVDEALGTVGRILAGMATPVRRAGA